MDIRFEHHPGRRGGEDAGWLSRPPLATAPVVFRQQHFRRAVEEHRLALLARTGPRRRRWKLGLGLVAPRLAPELS